MSNKTKEKEKNSVNENEIAINGCNSVEEFLKKGFSEIKDATARVNAFPQGGTRDLYCAYPTFGRVLDQQGDRILNLISHVLKGQNVRGNIQNRQPDDQFELLLECNDAIFERLQINLDEMAGVKSNPQTIVVETRINGKTQQQESAISTGASGIGSWNLKSSPKQSQSLVAARLITAKNIARPQVKFQFVVDNSPDTPFIPKLKEKPNSMKPLAILPEYDDADNVVSYLHPYEFELMKFEVPDALLKPKEDPQFPKMPESTELIYVNTVAELKNALSELRRAPELAIDVEHHSYRSFLGFTCLVQISTKEKDYIFDALELREDMHILNEVFTNSKVVKIFHGAELDIEWLQRDLSLYVVNMFDTHQAAKALNFARLSLAFLLKHFCNLEVDKTFQLADWRIRPLPAELLAYARQDTHYLIYIYEQLSNDLLKAGNQQPHLLRNVYQRSTEICKKRYSKPVILPDSHMEFYRKSKKLFDNRQLYALERIFQWRDAVARQEDESYHYVLPNHMLLQIAESLPREMQGILACCNPIPPIVRQQMHTLHQIILKAREQPLVKPIYETGTIYRQSINTVKEYNSTLYCPHDLTYMEEFRDDLPTLITFDKDGRTLTNSVDFPNVEMAKPKLSTFDSEARRNQEKKLAECNEIEKQLTLEPYYRYLAVLPMAKKEKLEEVAHLEAKNKKRQLCPSATTTPAEEVSQSLSDDENSEENLYKLPIKQMLKRQHEKSLAKKNDIANAQTSKTSTTATDDGTLSPQVKRFKTEPLSVKEEEPICNKLAFVNTPPTKKEIKQKKWQNHQQQRQQHQQQSPQLQQSNKKFKKQTENEDATVVGNVDNNSDDEAPEEVPIATSEMVDLTVDTTSKSKNRRNQNKKKRKQWKKQGANSKSFQASNKPVDTKVFDYSSVDFSKFKGGSQRACTTEIKQKIRGKGTSNKTQNKKFNKMFTFSNIKNNKK